MGSFFIVHLVPHGRWLVKHKSRDEKSVAVKIGDLFRKRMLTMSERRKLEGGAVGGEYRVDRAAIERYKKRREKRLNARCDDDGAHGNTRIPFGLCQREGIKIDPSWTPKDAWDALKKKGYSASATYRRMHDEEEIRRERKVKARKALSAKLKKTLVPKENEAVFYSGCAEIDEEGNQSKTSDEVARGYAETNAGKTMNMLMGEDTLDGWDSTEDDPIEMWKEASRIFAENASGDVRCVVRPPLREGNIFENVELPTLKKNRKVRKITVVNMGTGEEEIIFRRS